MENRRDPQTRTELKPGLTEQVNTCVQSGDYARALDLLRARGGETRNSAELSELEKQAEDGVKRKSEADRLITASQDLFAQQKSGEAIQLLRQAYELDKNNSLARAILANALAERAHSIVDTEWWESAKLAKQALELNPAHPTAKTIRSLLRDRKEASSVEEWASQAQKLQSSGDLIAALSLIAEGLDFHSRDSKLLLLQDAIQRDHDARRRQSRRADLEDLRRMESEVEKAKDTVAKKVLAERIQTLAAKYWTDGAVLTVANHLLQRLGMAPQESARPGPQGKKAPVIFHVPRPNASPTPHSAPSPTVPNLAPSSQALASQTVPSVVASAGVATAVVPANKVPSSKVPPPRVVRPRKIRIVPPERQIDSIQANTVPAPEVSAAAAEVELRPAKAKRPVASSSLLPILISVSVGVSAIILFAAIFFSARKNNAPPVAKAPLAGPIDTAPANSAPAPAPAPAVSDAGEPTRVASAPDLNATPVVNAAPAAIGKIATPEQPPAEAGGNLGTLVVVVGQDDARVLLNGKPQRLLTKTGQLRLPNLEPKDYVVQVSKSGFQDPPEQKIRIRKGEQARLVFKLEPQPRLAILTIQGGAPGTSVLVDQNVVGTIASDGKLSVASVSPGDHTVELRKERFKARQFKKHFVAGGAISLGGADAVLEAASGELRITFAPADANVAIVKGDLLKMVSSGVPLNLPPGTYTLTARTADRFTRSSTLEVTAGQSKAVDLSLAPNGMSKWEDAGAWKHAGQSFIRKGGNFVLYGAVPASGTFVFSAMLTKGHLLQWVFDYRDPKNYVLFQMDDNNFYRTAIRNGAKTDEIIVPHKADKKSFRTLHVRVGPTELVHQIQQGDRWIVLDRWTQPGVNFSLGKFGFYIPGNDEVELSSFAHYADLNVR